MISWTNIAFAMELPIVMYYFETFYSIFFKNLSINDERKNFQSFIMRFMTHMVEHNEE